MPVWTEGLRKLQLEITGELFASKCFWLDFGRFSQVEERGGWRMAKIGGRRGDAAKAEREKVSSSSIFHTALLQVKLTV